MSFSVEWERVMEVSSQLQSIETTISYLKDALTDLPAANLRRRDLFAASILLGLLVTGQMRIPEDVHRHAAKLLGKTIWSIADALDQNDPQLPSAAPAPAPAAPAKGGDDGGGLDLGAAESPE